MPISRSRLGSGHPRKGQQSQYLHEARLARAQLLAARGDPDAPAIAAEALARAEADGYLIVVPPLRKLAGQLEPTNDMSGALSPGEESP